MVSVTGKMVGQEPDISGKGLKILLWEPGKSCLENEEGPMAAQRPRWDERVYTVYPVYTVGTQEPQWKAGDRESS